MTGCGDRMADLLQLFSDGLGEWDEGVAAGLAALAALQRSLGELEVSQPAREAINVMERLLQLAPSFNLENYIQQQHKPPVTASDAANSIHQAVTKLKEAVAEQKDLVASLTTISGQYQETVLSQQLTDLAVSAPPTADMSAQESSHCSAAGSCEATAASESLTAGDQQQDSLSLLLNTAAAAAADTAASAATDTAAAAAAASDTAAAAASDTAAGNLQPEELALLMDVVISMLEQELQLMEAAVSSISLESSQEDLSTLITLWEVQPFTHEQAVASLLAAAAKELEET